MLSSNQIKRNIELENMLQVHKKQRQKFIPNFARNFIRRRDQTNRRLNTNKEKELS